MAVHCVCRGVGESKHEPSEYCLRTDYRLALPRCNSMLQNWCVFTPNMTASRYTLIHYQCQRLFPHLAVCLDSACVCLTVCACAATDLPASMQFHATELSLFPPNIKGMLISSSILPFLMFVPPSALSPSLCVCVRDCVRVCMQPTCLLPIGL